MKKIDIHVHTTMWEKAYLQPGCVSPTPADLRKSYAELDVDKAFILPLVSPEYKFSISTNEEAQYLAEKHSDLFYWCCNLDPRMGHNSAEYDFSEMLMYYKERGAVGLGELTANLPVDDPMMDNLFYHCAECDMPVIIHIATKNYNTYGIIDDIKLPKIEKLLKKYPKLKLVGHSQCFWSEISSDVTEENRGGYPTGKVTEGRIVELMRNYPNLYCDMSAGSGFNAISRDLDFSGRFIEEFGDRLMYGTDICRPGQRTHLAKWLDDSLASGLISEQNYKNICRENAIRIFNLTKEKA